MFNLVLEYREGPFEGGLEPVTAIWILDARAPPEPVPRGPNIRSIGYQEIHPRQDRVHPAIACFSYGAGVFGTAKAEVAFVAPLVTLPPPLPLPTLAKIKIFTTPPDGPIQTPPPAILTIPGSYLRSLQLTFHPADDEAFGNSVSATILQCGAFLERLETSVRLSEAAVSHLVGLRYLRTLRIGSDPHQAQPSPPASSLHSKVWSLTTEWATNGFLS